MGAYRTVCLLVAQMVAIPCAAQTVGSLAINAGTATDITGAGASAVTIAPAFTRSSALSTSTMGASATRFSNDAWTASLGLGLNGRTGLGVVTPVIDIAASAATTSYDLSYASADVIPSIEARAGVSRFFAGARLGAAGRSAIASTTPNPSIGPLPTGSQGGTSATARTIIGGASLSAISPRGEVTSAGYRAETGEVAGARQTEHALNASLGSSKVIVSGLVARRTRGGEATMYANAMLGVVATPTVMIQLAAGNYASNPMLGTSAGKFVNAGISMRLARRTRALPTPAGVPAAPRGMTRVSILAEEARRVEIAGDFNKWKPTTTTRAGNGVWFVDLVLPPGEYRYAFRIDGKEWRVPEGVAAVDDEFGGRSAWLKVSLAASKQDSSTEE